MSSFDWPHILNAVTIAVLGSIALSIVASVVVLIKWLSGLTKISAQLIKLTERLDKRGEENQLLFEWVNVLGTAMKKGVMDGSLEKMEAKTDDYLRQQMG